ncbi:hypothetical protein [Vibrio salinus]|uniref:hypothetical protein n=1 Tax=Vibrio salinus TaxID=2899784 RepID=UPI001E422255|nr:hypothetical protein [Vibrio salinus]MCE0495172.1 hypothetical protein [Vibrio salinus]
MSAAFLDLCSVKEATHNWALGLLKGIMMTKNNNHIEDNELTDPDPLSAFVVALGAIGSIAPFFLSSNIDIAIRSVWSDKITEMRLEIQ